MSPRPPRNRRGLPQQHPEMVRVVRQFAGWIETFHGRIVRELRFLDEEGPGNPECDAIASIDGQRTRIEHTRVFFSENERGIQVLLERVRAALAEALRVRHPDCSTSIGIPAHELVDHEVRQGVAERIAEVCSPVIAALPPGARESIPSALFEGPILVWKRAVDFDHGVHQVFATASPESPGGRAGRQVEVAIGKKARKHGNPGSPTILILDSPTTTGPNMHHIRPLAGAASRPESRAFQEMWLAGSATDPVCFVGPVSAGPDADPDDLYLASVARWERLRKAPGR